MSVLQFQLLQHNNLLLLNVSYLYKLNIFWFWTLGETCTPFCYFLTFHRLLLHINHRCKLHYIVELRMTKMLVFGVASDLFLQRFFQFSPGFSRSTFESIVVMCSMSLSQFFLQADQATQTLQTWQLIMSKPSYSIVSEVNNCDWRGSTVSIISGDIPVLTHSTVFHLDQDVDGEGINALMSEFAFCMNAFYEWWHKLWKREIFIRAASHRLLSLSVYLQINFLN